MSKVIKFTLLACVMVSVFSLSSGAADASGLLRERLNERMAQRSGGGGESGGSIRERIRERMQGGEAGAGQSGLKDRFSQMRGGGDKGDAMTIAGLDVAVWEPKSGAAPFPLVLFSHGFNGCNTQSKFLMTALADAGYLVVAPNHDDASCGNGFNRPAESFRNPEAWGDATYSARRDDMYNLVEGLRSNSKFNNEIDWSRVALAGHSLGGYTVLGLAGGWSSWKMPQIRAVLALSPVCTPYTAHNTLGQLSVPVMYQGGTRDMGVTPFVKKPGGCYDTSPSPAYFVEFKGAGHFSFSDMVGSDVHPDINYYSIAFLDTYVKGDREAAQKLSNQLPDVTDMRAK